MPDQRRELYREFQPWGTWVYFLLWGVIGASAVPILMGLGDTADSSYTQRITLAGILLLSPVLIQVLFGGLLVTVEREGVRAGLGKLRLLKTYIAFSDIAGMESVTYKPLREFGGWGIRGTSQKRAWTGRGDRAVAIRLKDGRQVYIGSDEPNRLEGRIRNAMSAGGYRLDQQEEE